ncbi:MAG: hypothetical protein ACR2O6_08825 [Ilumatobacteraceae bacterium]
MTTIRQLPAVFGVLLLGALAACQDNSTTDGTGLPGVPGSSTTTLPSDTTSTTIAGDTTIVTTTVPTSDPTTTAATATTTPPTAPPTDPPPTDAATSTTSSTTTTSTTTAPLPPPCGPAAVPPIPAGAVEVNSITLDAIGDGSADDTATSYFDPGTSQWRIRMDLPSGPTDEIEVTGVGAGAVRVLGPAQVGSIDGTGLQEFLAIVGSGAATINVGAFGTDDVGCLFRFTKDGAPFVAPIGATITRADGLRCTPTTLETRSAVDAGGGLWDVTTQTLAREFTMLNVSASSIVGGVATDDLGDIATLDCPGMSL